MKRAHVPVSRMEVSFFLCICMMLLFLLPTPAGAAGVKYRIGGADFVNAEDLGAAIPKIEGDGTTALTAPVTIDILSTQTSNGTWVMGIKGTATPLFPELTIRGYNGGMQTVRGAGTPGGRLLVLTNSTNVTVKDLTFSGGNHVATAGAASGNGTTSGGGGLFVGADDELGDAFKVTTYNVTQLGMNNVRFTGNTVRTNSTQVKNGKNYAVGGGLSVQNIGSVSGGATAKLTNLSFTKNSAIYDGSGASDSTDGNTQGGGARIYGIETVEMASILFKDNQSRVTKGLHANGGGLAIRGGNNSGKITATLDMLRFENNTAGITGGGRWARGGGLYVFDETTGNNSIVNVSNSVFTGNIAEAEGADINAMGGGVNVWRNSNGSSFTATFTDSVFENNRANGKDNAYGFGGALYLSAPDSGASEGHQIVGTRITDNHASTAGGGIFADTDADAFTLTLTAKTGKNDTVIQGNTAGADKHASGIEFQGAKNGTLNIAGDGKVWLMDPVIAKVDGAFTMDVTNTGAFYWDGANAFQAGNGTGITFNDEATINTGRYFSAAATDDKTMKVTFKGATTINIDVNRADDLPLFDYTNGETTGSEITFGDNNSTLHIGVTDVDRQLMDKKGRLLLVKVADDMKVSGFKFTLDKATYDDRLSDDNNGQPIPEDNKLYLGYSFKSDHQAAVMAYANSASALPQLHEAVQLRYGITDQQYEALKSNWASATPNYGPAQAQAAVQASALVGDSARARGTRSGKSTLPGAARSVAGLGQDTSASAPDSSASVFDMPTAAGPASPYRYRLWGGYIGNFSSMDSHGGHLGYDSDTHGGMVGFSVDFAEDFTIGLYSAYTDGNTDMKGVDSEVDTDGMHVGAVFGWTPSALPGLGLSADFTYSFYDNDAWRMVGGQKNKASFDQNVYSLGLGGEFAFGLTENVFLTPFLNLRYSHIEQDSFTESGQVLATHVGSLDGDSFTTTPGLRLEGLFQFDGGSFAPYISAGWRHEWADRDFTSHASYRNVPGNVWRLDSVEADRDSADLGLGFEVLKNLEGGKQLGLNVSFDANISDKSESNNIYAGIVFNF